MTQEMWKLIEREAGEILHEEKFSGTTKEAEQRQSDRWNKHYSSGELRVTSTLYYLHSRRTADGWVSRWRKSMSIGL